MFFIARPKKPENIMTGKMQPIITRVNSHDKMNTNIKAKMTKMIDLMNIETLVERPS